MDIKTIYIATCGKYEDISISGAFSTFEAALRYTKSKSDTDEYNIEEHIVDLDIKLLDSQGFSRFSFLIDRDGNTSDLKVSDGPIDPFPFWLPSPDSIYLHVNAICRNEDEALTKANERRLMLIEYGEWR